MVWLVAGLILTIILLIIKIVTMKKSVREIRADFAMRIRGDHNSGITVSSRDKDICKLATDMNEALKEQRKMYLLYYQGDREMKTAITNISHDLRTPLTAISGYLELLKEEEKSETVEKYIDVIDERTRHMKNLTEEMFEYSMITATEDAEVPSEDVDLNRMLEDCIMDYYAALTEKNISLSVDITESRIIRRLNRTQTERVFSNLISNALKYSDGDLSISMDDNGEIIFSNSAQRLSQVSAERLFGRFYTVENARNSTGLGLSIAKTFVERMNGSINAEYRDGRLYIIIDFPSSPLP